MIISRTIGIDLGTTNSAVAVLGLDERELVLGADPQGRTSVPSCVWADPRTGDVVVGHRAYARRGRLPEPVSSIKRSMGAQVSTPLGQTPQEISAHVLRELKSWISAALAERSPQDRYDVGRAIITVPAYFGLAAIEATRQAGELAGIEVAELLHEPTAAAIYHSWQHDLGDGVYLVYDLGGGTFDVSVLRRVAGEFSVLGIAGDNFLGGDDFDRRLAEHLRRVLVADGYDLELDLAGDQEDRLRFNQLVVLAERAKKELSGAGEILLRDQGTLRDRQGEPVIVELVLDRTTFDELIDDLLTRTVDLCRVALEKAAVSGGITPDEVDHVVLVGGSTHVPAVVEKVREAFPGRRCVRDEPETAVALGAALRAAALGVGLGDDEGTVRVWLRSPGATRRETPTISGHVEVLRPGRAPVAVRLLDPSGSVVREAELTAGNRFVLPRVELTPETVNDFGIEVVDGNDVVIASVRRAIQHSSAQREGVGSTLSTAVLAEPVVLEGTDGDQLVRRVLLPDGTPLPATASFTFAVADGTGRVRLPLYQANRIIKELHAEVGPVPAGTPVAFEISCDEQVHITVSATVGDRTFGGRIEPPPPEAVPTAQRLAGLDAAMSTVDSPELAAAYARVRRELDEARAGGDDAKVIQRAADLAALVRAATAAQENPLEPPLAELEELFQSCVDQMGGDTSVRLDLDLAIHAAREAYAARDRDRYDDAAGRLSALHDYLAQRQVPDLDPHIRALAVVQYVRDVLTDLAAECGTRSGLASSVRRHLAELTSLEPKALRDPAEVLRRCQALLADADRIRAEVAPGRPAGSHLDGLLRLRGHQW